MENKCKICGCVPYFKYDMFNKYGRFSPYDSTISIGSDCEGYVSLRAGKDRDNKTVILAIGDDTDYYYPNYCPECGRKLKECE